MPVPAPEHHAVRTARCRALPVSLAHAAVPSETAHVPALARAHRTFADRTDFLRPPARGEALPVARTS
ncbi:MAG: hypothetical protein RL199_1522 [Pseudomonadota bacterium]|jgi:hypothetical protein